MSDYRSNGGTLVPLTALRITKQNILYYDDETIRRYVDRMQKGDEIDPIEVSDDGSGV